MTAEVEFRTPTYEELVSEQRHAQAGKFQGRTLPEYEQHIFPGRSFRTLPSNAVTDFLAEQTATETNSQSLQTFIETLQAMKRPAGFHWADMGAGRALAMRQFANSGAFISIDKLSYVDLFRFGLAGVKEDELTFLEKLSTGMTQQSVEAKMHFVQADVEYVQLDSPADLITSVETIQYLNNPVAAICNWYNQLADDGILLVCAEHEWSDWMRHEKADHSEPIRMLTANLLEALRDANVPHAASDALDGDDGYRPNRNRLRQMAVKKLAATAMTPNAELVEIWTSPYDYKATYYRLEPDAPLVTITNQ